MQDSWGIIIKKFMHNNNSPNYLAPNKMVYGELGRYPLFVNSTLRYFKYWFRVLKMEDIGIPKQEYKMMILMDDSEKKYWVTEVKNVLSRNGCLVTTRGWR